jgi:hypothetical protein
MYLPAYRKVLHDGLLADNNFFPLKSMQYMHSRSLKLRIRIKQVFCTDPGPALVMPKRPTTNEEIKGFGELNYSL